MKSFLILFLSVISTFHLYAQSEDLFDLGLDPVLSEEIPSSDSAVSSGDEKNVPSTTLKADAKQNRSIYIVNQATSGSKADSASKSEQS